MIDMEDSKRIYKFYGKPREDFSLWCARPEAALAAKEVLLMVESDVFADGDAIDESVMRQVATARAILIQGLGDRPLRLCLTAKDNPFKMWARLKDRYAVSNIATRVQLQTRLSRVNYKGQSMQDYDDLFEEIFNRLAAMKSEIAEDLQVAMLLPSFGDKKQSAFGHTIASLQTLQEKRDWETATAMWLQEHDDQLLRSGTTGKLNESGDSASALAASGLQHYRGKRQNRWKKRSTYKQGKRRCHACGKPGHISRDCLTKDGRARTVSFADDSDFSAQANLGQSKNAKLLMVRSCDRETGTSADSQLQFGSSESSNLCKEGKSANNTQIESKGNALRSTQKKDRDKRIFLLD